MQAFWACFAEIPLSQNVGGATVVIGALISNKKCCCMLHESGSQMEHLDSRVFCMGWMDP